MAWIVFAVIGVFLGVLYAQVKADDDLREAERARFDRVMQANDRPWTPPSFSRPAAKGFQQRRVG